VRLGLGESGDMEICFGDENGNDQTVTKNYVDEKESRRRQVATSTTTVLKIIYIPPYRRPRYIITNTRLPFRPLFFLFCISTLLSNIKVEIKLLLKYYLRTESTRLELGRRPMTYKLIILDINIGCCCGSWTLLSLRP
jgi:hypothetical protein